MAPLNVLIGQPVSLMQQKGSRCTLPSYKSFESKQHLSKRQLDQILTNHLLFHFGHSIYRLLSSPFSVSIHQTRIFLPKGTEKPERAQLKWLQRTHIFALGSHSCCPGCWIGNYVFKKKEKRKNEIKYKKKTYSLYSRFF